MLGWLKQLPFPRRVQIDGREASSRRLRSTTRRATVHVLKAPGVRVVASPEAIDSADWRHAKVSMLRRLRTADPAVRA